MSAQNLNVLNFISLVWAVAYEHVINVHIYSAEWKPTKRIKTV